MIGVKPAAGPHGQCSGFRCICRLSCACDSAPALRSIVAHSMDIDWCGTTHPFVTLKVLISFKRKVVLMEPFAYTRAMMPSRLSSAPIKNKLMLLRLRVSDRNYSRSYASPVVRPILKGATLTWPKDGTGHSVHAQERRTAAVRAEAHAASGGGCGQGAREICATVNRRHRIRADWAAG